MHSDDTQQDLNKDLIICYTPTVNVFELVFVPHSDQSEATQPLSAASCDVLIECVMSMEVKSVFESFGTFQVNLKADKDI